MNVRSSSQPAGGAIPASRPKLIFASVGRCDSLLEQSGRKMLSISERPEETNELRKSAELDFDPERYDRSSSQSWHQADALEQIDQIR